MSEKIYDIDYRRLVRWCIPFVLRKGLMISWLNALVSPVVRLYNLFIRYRQAKLYQLSITPQVCYMEKMLNDRFDNTARRIYIEDGLRADPVYLFLEAENKPLYLYTEVEAQPVYLYTEGETSLEGNDFIVFVPVGLGFDEVEMRALINSYKLAGKRYSIQIV